jgi:mono/diheme cytochrome c family protein
MKYGLNLLLAVVIVRGGLSAHPAAGDSVRGEQLLRDRGCLMCHALDGQGAHTAPDLGRRISRDYTPAFLAGLIWNHAPSMWIGSGKADIFSLTENETADLLAYFCSRRYFDHPGDAARGKQVFAGRHCAGCHGISESTFAGASPVAAWHSLGDPIALAQAMWNRPQLMRAAFARRGIRSPRLTSQELTDLLIYLENLPETRGQRHRFRLASPRTGRMIFQVKGCGECHRGRLSLEGRGSRLAPADVAAGMWNHASGEGHPSLSYEEMGGIAGYLWFMNGRGDARRGRRLFAAKKCAACHASRELPSLHGSDPQTVPVSFTTALLSHGPAMLAEMRRMGVRWPRFAGKELGDLGAYLAARRLADERSPGTRIARSR